MFLSGTRKDQHVTTEKLISRALCADGSRVRNLRESVGASRFARADKKPIARASDREKGNPPWIATRIGFPQRVGLVTGLRREFPYCFITCQFGPLVHE
jgi:hypothetical protein